MKDAKLNISLLFVEDEDETRKNITEMISRTIANFYVARNAIEALEMFGQYKPEIVLSDIKMPGMNGLQMVEKMKQINPQLKTIMMSAFTDTNYLLKSIDLQVDGYIIKPIRKEKLISTLQKQADIILLEKKVEKHKNDLIKSEENYRLLTETMKDVVVRISLTGELLYLSPAAEGFGGYMHEEEVGGDISKFFAVENDYQRAVKLIAEVVQTHKSGSFEFMYKPKNKAPFPVELTYVPLIKSGKIYAIQMVLRDITERKNAELALQESEAQLRETNKTKDKFFSIIAHDLRSPFNTLLGFSEILNDEFDEYSTKEKKRFIGIIYKGLQNTLKLLDNLLYWARSQKGTIAYNPEKINLLVLTNEISELLNQSIENKSIKLINELELNTYVEADRDMLATIIRNLLSNAIKFTNKHGEITIKTFLVSGKNHNQFVGISVSDTGVGIPKEVQSKIFDIGENTSTKGTENETGTGLGLILCKEFVKKHGGKIWVESEVGNLPGGKAGGSTFYFTMPY